MNGAFSLDWVQKKTHLMKLARISGLHLVAHVAALMPGALLLADALTNNLTVNPIQTATQRLGRAAILLLISSLAVTPLVTLTGFRRLHNLARPLGLYAFFYVVLHLYLFLGVDYGFDFGLLWADINVKWYIFIGLGAFLILLPLAVTSFRWWMKRLGKRWKRLHRLVYLAGGLAVVHYGLAAKGDFFRLKGDVFRPILYGLLLIFLLGLRVPTVRRAVINLREQAVQAYLEKRRTIRADQNLPPGGLDGQ